jgi:hypothetical protein
MDETKVDSDLFKKLKELFVPSSNEDKDWSASRVIEKIPRLMQIIEESNLNLRMSGKAKKEILLSFLRAHIAEQEDPGDETALFFVDTVLPPMIDMVNSVDKREIVIALGRCRRKCFGCFGV